MSAGTDRVGFSLEPVRDGPTEPGPVTAMAESNGIDGPATGKSLAPARYRPPVDVRHWAKAGLVVRIIFHPWASRLAISGPLRAVMPQATLWARHAFRMVWKASSTSGALASTPRY